MGLDSFVLNLPHVADKLDAATRKREKVSTPDEVRAKVMLRDEKTLQSQIASYLNLLGVEFINPPMHKRSMLPISWPDFTLAYRGVPVCVEAKVWGEEPRPDQKQRMEKLAANGWVCIVAHELDDLRSVLRNIDEEKAG